MNRFNFAPTKLFSVVLFAVIVAACGGSDGGDSDGAVGTELLEPKPTIRIVGDNSSIVSVIAEKLVETHLRYPVAVQLGGPSTKLIEDLEDGRVDVALEVWPSRLDDASNRLISEGRAEDLGELGAKAKQGWFVPDYILDSFPNLNTWEGFKDESVAEVFATEETAPNGRFLGIDPEGSELDELIIANLGLPLQVEYAGSDDLVEAEIRSRVEADDPQPILVLATSPSYVVEKYGLVPVDTPVVENCLQVNGQNLPCDHSEQELVKLASPGLKDKSEAVYKFVSSFSVSDEDLKQMTLEVGEGKSISQVADEWIEANESLWVEWVEE